MWEFLGVTSGIYGAGLCRACNKSCAEWMASLVNTILGMLDFWGEKSTISEILSGIVLGI